jgi:hypothetical protein
MVLSLLLLPYMAFAAMAVESYDNTLMIREGDNHYWEVEGSGTLEFRVEVLSGGTVDVLITDDAPFGMVFYYEDHKYTNKRLVEDEFPMQDSSEYLVIDNSNEIGVHTTGDVTVKVKFELTGQAASLLLGLLLPIIVLVLVVLGIVVRRSRMSSTRADNQVETVYVDESGRRIGSSMEPPPAAAMAAPSESQWCPGCGAEMRWDPSVGRAVCPYCRL